MRSLAQRLLTLAAIPVAIATGRPFLVDAGGVAVEAEVRATIHSFIARVAEPIVEIDGDAATGRVANVRLIFRWDALKTGNAARDTAMLAWAGADRFPEVAFNLTSIEAADGGAMARGTLKMHGKERPIAFPIGIQAAGDGGRVFSGNVAVDSRDWGLPRIRFLLVFSVDPVVTVKFSVPVTPP